MLSLFMLGLWNQCSKRCFKAPLYDRSLSGLLKIFMTVQKRVPLVQVILSWNRVSDCCLFTFYFSQWKIEVEVFLLLFWAWSVHVNSWSLQAVQVTFIESGSLLFCDFIDMNFAFPLSFGINIRSNKLSWLFNWSGVKSLAQALQILVKPLQIDDKNVSCRCSLWCWQLCVAPEHTLLLLCDGVLYNVRMMYL